MRPAGVPWIPPPRPVDDWPATPFGDYCRRQRAKHGARFIPPTCEKWIKAYNNGPSFKARVKTTYPGGGQAFIRWGHVALTAGWVPSFMLMARRTAHGSSDLLLDTDEIIETKWVP